MPLPLCSLPRMTGQARTDPVVRGAGESFLRAGEMIVPLAPSSSLGDVPCTSPWQNSRASPSGVNMDELDLKT